MKDRLIQLRKALNLSMEAFGKKIGVGRSTISRLESGTNGFTDQMTRSICREFGVNYEWFVSGVGEMFSEVPQTVVDELCAQYDLDEFDRIMIQEYLKLDESSRNVLKAYIRSIMKRVGSDDTQAKIDAEVESYRQELELEARQADESSASDTPAENMA